MPAPTRYPAGVNNTRKGGLPLWNLPFLDPTRCHTYFNDFDTFVVGDWVITTTEAGTGNATEALTDEDGGVLLVTNDDADNDADFFQLVAEGFLLDLTKQAWFKARFKVSEATQSDVVMGLQIKDTTPLDVTDGIYFLKPDDAATVNFICGKDATTGRMTKSAVSTLTTAYTEWAWYYDGRGMLTAFVNNLPVTSFDPTAYFPDTELTVSFGIQNGSAGAKTLSLDYLMAAKER